MKERIYVMENALPVKDSEVITKNLEALEPICAIWIQFTATNGASGNVNNWINDVITKVEVVEGTTELASLSMKELQVLNFFSPNRRHMVLRPSDKKSGDQVEGILLPFGRWLWDKDLAFRPDQHKSPQLKVTINLAAVRAVGADGFLASSGLLTIVAYIMEGLATPPMGFLLSREQKSWTTLGSGDEPTDLNVDYKYRNIILGSYKYWRDFELDYKKVKLDINEGARIPLDIDGKDLWELNVDEFGEMEYRHDYLTFNGQLIHTILNHDPVFTPKSLSALRFFYFDYEFSGEGKIRVSDSAGAAVNVAEDVRCKVRGSSPHASAIIEFGDRDDPDDWLDMADVKKLKLIVSQGSAGGNAKIISQQLKPY